MQNLFYYKDFESDVKSKFSKIKPEQLEMIVQNKVIQDILSMTSAKKPQHKSPFQQ